MPRKMFFMLVIMTLVISGEVLYAQNEIETSHPYSSVILGGEMILVFRADAGGYSPQERWEIIQGRLVRILADPTVTPRSVRVATSNGTTAIWVGRHLFVTVPPEGARANHTTVANLAQVWAGNLRRALTMVLD